MLLGGLGLVVMSGETGLLMSLDIRVNEVRNKTCLPAWVKALAIE
jgi:hypothetical protein